MGFGSRISGLRQKLCSTSQNFKQSVRLPAQTRSTALEDNNSYPAPDRIQMEFSETIAFIEENVIPTIRSSRDPPPARHSAETVPRANATQECDCRVRLLERLRHILARHLVPVLDEFSSCRCHQHQYRDTNANVSTGSGYDTVSTTSLVRLRGMRMSFSTRQLRRSFSLLPRRRESLSCCNLENVSSCDSLPPRRRVETVSESNQVVRVPRRLSIAPEVADEGQREHINRCVNCGESVEAGTPSRNIMTWMDDIPRDNDIEAARPPISTARLRRKRRVSNLCHQIDEE